MKDFLFRVVFVLTTIFFLNLAPRAWADQSSGELSDAAKGGIGCAILTGVTLIGSLAAGPGELIMIAGGGSLAPSSTTPLMISLTATSYVAACGIGISATPAVLWFSEQIGTFLDDLWGNRNAPASNIHRQAGPILAARGESSSNSAAVAQSSR